MTLLYTSQIVIGKIATIFFLLISYTAISQELIDYKAISYFYIERINGKKAFSKPVEIKNNVYFNLENKIVKISGIDENIYKIVNVVSERSESGNSIVIYNCMDENEVECRVSLFSFLYPNTNGASKQLFVSYPNIEYVYDLLITEK